MKKVLFILAVLFSCYSYSQQNDTIIPPRYTPPLDTVTYTYIMPEVMNESLCYDNGYYDNLMPPMYNNEVGKLACDERALKSVAQGFNFEESVSIEGVYAIIGLATNYVNPYSPVGFKMGVMDSEQNVIYEKEYILGVPDNMDDFGTFYRLTFVPFDSVLHLNDFVYLFVEWPDSSCVGGEFDEPNLCYYDDYPRMVLRSFKENPLTYVPYEEYCPFCHVKYEPLFKWYGDNKWTELSSLECELKRYVYTYPTETGSAPTSYYPPIGVALYYSNNNNNNNDSGLSETDISNLVSLSPNPANDVVTVQSSFKIREMEIHNALGQVVLRKEGSQNIETLDVSILESGVYVVRIKTQRGFANKKLIIK